VSQLEGYDFGALANYKCLILAEQKLKRFFLSLFNNFYSSIGPVRQLVQLLPLRKVGIFQNLHNNHQNTATFNRGVHNKDPRVFFLSGARNF
jgi:hypothetical protein